MAVFGRIAVRHPQQSVVLHDELVDGPGRRVRSVKYSRSSDLLYVVQSRRHHPL